MNDKNTVTNIPTLFESLPADQQKLYLKNQKFYSSLIKAINDKTNNGTILDNPLAWIAEYYAENYTRNRLIFNSGERKRHLQTT